MEINLLASGRITYRPRTNTDLSSYFIANKHLVYNNTSAILICSDGGKCKTIDQMQITSAPREARFSLQVAKLEIVSSGNDE